MEHTGLDLPTNFFGMFSFAEYRGSQAIPCPICQLNGLAIALKFDNHCNWAKDLFFERSTITWNILQDGWAVEELIKPAAFNEFRPA
jgi:hypothetical protein